MIQVREETNWKIWVGVGALGFVLVYLATFSAGKLVQKASYEPEGAVYSYQMPRVESAEAPFDLSGRNVERKIIGALEGSKAGLGATGSATATLAKDKNLKAKAKSSKPNLTPAQAKALAAKKNADIVKAKNLAKAKALHEERRRRFQMQILQDKERARFQAEMEAGGDWNPMSVNFVGGFEGSAPAQDAGPGDSKKEEDETLSVAQWRALLQVSPSASNVSRLVKALGKGEVEVAAFYQIAKELLMDSAADRRKAGLLLLSSVATVASYEFMVLHQSEFSPEVQAELKQEIAKYSQPAYLSVTSRVLSTSKESAVLSSALGNLTTAVEAYKKQPAPGTISGQGGSKEPRITISALSQFLNGLNGLGQSEDPLLADQAKNLTRTIQDIKK